MLRYFIRRAFAAIPVLLCVVTVTFFLVRLAPGGPFDTEKSLPPQIIKNLNERYHLSDPMWQQYTDYLINILHFDFGPSFKFPDRTVTELITTGLPVTFELGFYALLFSVLIGVCAGVIAATKPNHFQDYMPMSVAMIGICMPSFLIGPLLVLIFSLGFGWFPVSGWDSAAHKILPAITLGGGYAAYIARLCRGGMLEILSQDFIRTARAKGVSESRILWKHAFRGGILPVVSFLGPAAAGLLSGSFVVETIFQIPGLGRFYVQAAFNRDYTMIMGTTIFFSALIVVFNLLSDMFLIWLNPRLSFFSTRGSS